LNGIILSDAESWPGFNYKYENIYFLTKKIQSLMQRAHYLLSSECFGLKTSVSLPWWASRGRSAGSCEVHALMRRSRSGWSSEWQEMRDSVTERSAKISIIRQDDV